MSSASVDGEVGKYSSDKRSMIDGLRECWLGTLTINLRAGVVSVEAVAVAGSDDPETIAFIFLLPIRIPS